MNNIILRIALPLPIRRLFDYRAPKEVHRDRLSIGIRLRVVFKNRIIIGFLVKVLDSTGIPERKLKNAIPLDNIPVIPSSLLNFFYWGSQYYHCSLGDIFNSALPYLLRKGHSIIPERREVWRISQGITPDKSDLSRAPRQRSTLKKLIEYPEGLEYRVLKKFLINKRILTILSKKNLVEMVTTKNDLDYSHHLYKKKDYLISPHKTLNQEQQVVFDTVKLHLNEFQVFLLAGVTGSGKTELYLQLIHATLKNLKQVLVLVPEINLVPQIFKIFKERFNRKIILVHSSIKKKERLEGWVSAREGVADIILGTRSALFTPMKNPGMIIIDEEHDTAYKQQDGLRYHARDLAVVRAKQEGIPIILGSATPSIESLYNALQGRYTLLKIEKRAGGSIQPNLSLLDIKNLSIESGMSVLAEQAIKNTLDSEKQVLVFLNRRGYASVLLCFKCRWIAVCKNCDTRITIHQTRRKLLCHHCGYSEDIPKKCPKCYEVNLRYLGNGTEKVEERLKILFPNHPILRIDRDTTLKKNYMSNVLAIINSGKPCVLIGTQIVSKGHDFPKITLVLILDADGALFSSDFRASEHLAQMISQVSGRAGRSKHLGRVIIQSRLTENPLLKELIKNDYLKYTRKIIAERQSVGLPPFINFALLRVQSSEHRSQTFFLDQAFKKASSIARNHSHEDLEILGPIPAAIERCGNKHHAYILIQSKDKTTLHILLTNWIIELEKIPRSTKVHWTIDVDPISIL